MATANITDGFSVLSHADGSRRYELIAIEREGDHPARFEIWAYFSGSAHMLETYGREDGKLTRSMFRYMAGEFRALVNNRHDSLLNRY